MGLASSAFAGVQLCTRRIVTWLQCLVLVGGLMVVMLIAVIYGITIGYHTAQTELVNFAMKARGVEMTTKFTYLRHGKDTEVTDETPSEELFKISSNNTETVLPSSTGAMRGLELYDTRPPTTEFDISSETPIFIEYKDRPTTLEPVSIEELPVRRLIGRIRRSKNDILAKSNFWKPLRRIG